MTSEQETDHTPQQYKAVKLSYSGDSPTATDGFLGGGKRGVDLSEVNEMVDEGWKVHTFSYDEDGCWQEAIMVKVNND